MNDVDMVRFRDLLKRALSSKIEHKRDFEEQLRQVLQGVDWKTKSPLQAEALGVQKKVWNKHSSLTKRTCAMAFSVSIRDYFTKLEEKRGSKVTANEIAQTTGIDVSTVSGLWHGHTTASKEMLSKLSRSYKELKLYPSYQALWDVAEKGVKDPKRSKGGTRAKPFSVVKSPSHHERIPKGVKETSKKKKETPLKAPKKPKADSGQLSLPTSTEEVSKTKIPCPSTLRKSGCVYLAGHRGPHMAGIGDTKHFWSDLNSDQALAAETRKPLTPEEAVEVGYIVSEEPERCVFAHPVTGERCIRLQNHLGLPHVFGTSSCSSLDHHDERCLQEEGHVGGHGGKSLEKTMEETLGICGDCDPNEATGFTCERPKGHPSSHRHTLGPNKFHFWGDLYYPSRESVKVTASTWPESEDCPERLNNLHCTLRVGHKSQHCAVRRDGTKRYWWSSKKELAPAPGVTGASSSAPTGPIGVTGTTGSSGACSSSNGLSLELFEKSLDLASLPLDTHKGMKTFIERLEGMGKSGEEIIDFILATTKVQGM